LDLSEDAVAADGDGDGLSPVVDIDLFANEADVADCFHNCLAEELGSWFGLGEWRAVEEWRDLGFSVETAF